MTSRYGGHERLVRPARASAELWRLGIGLFIAFVVMFGLSRAALALVHLIGGEAVYRALQAELSAADTPVAMLTLLFLLGAMGVGALVATHLVHRRNPIGLFGPVRLCLRQFLAVLLAAVCLHALVLVLPPWPKVAGLQPNLDVFLWLRLLPLTLLALLVQVGGEELLFRGYLQSQLAARFARPVVWMTLPSALFALGHYAPEAFGANATLVAVWAFVFGLVAADLTARAGTLGPAIALHLVNNFMAIALVSLPGEMSGLALWTLPFAPGDTAALRSLLPFDLVLLALAWLSARLVLRA